MVRHSRRAGFVRLLTVMATVGASFGLASHNVAGVLSMLVIATAGMAWSSHHDWAVHAEAGKQGSPGCGQSINAGRELRGRP